MTSPRTPTILGRTASPVNFPGNFGGKFEFESYFKTLCVSIVVVALLHANDLALSVSSAVVFVRSIVLLVAFFKMDVVEQKYASSSSSAPANEESKQYAAAAQYYVANRFHMPKLINEYCAIRQSVYPPASQGNYPMVASGRLVIRSSNADVNQVGQWEPVITWNLLNTPGSGLLTNLYTRYDEWRIRVCKVSFDSWEAQRVGVNNGTENWSLNVPKWVWYNCDHQQSDAENPFPDFLSLKRAMKGGENLKPVGQQPDKGFAITFVPQAVAQDDTTGGLQYHDMPMPWVPCDETHKAMAFRGPSLVWRLPYNPTPRDEQTLLVTFHAVIEFRGLDYNKL